MLFLHSNNVFNIDRRFLSAEAALKEALIKAQSNGLFIFDDEIVSVDICSDKTIQIWGRDLKVDLFPVEIKNIK